MRQPVPLTVANGIVADIVPLAVELSVPMLVGDAKLPAELLNCAVNTLPELNVPVFVQETLTLEPEQNGEPEIAEVVIVCALITFTPPKSRNKTATNFLIKGGGESNNLN